MIGISIQSNDLTIASRGTGEPCRFFKQIPLWLLPQNWQPTSWPAPYAER